VVAGVRASDSARRVEERRRSLGSESVVGIGIGIPPATDLPLAAAIALLLLEGFA
jgi:hypothetical protein